MRTAAVVIVAALGALISACENKNTEPGMSSQEPNGSSGRYATTTSPPPAYTYNDTAGSGTRYPTAYAPSQDQQPAATTYDTTGGGSDERLSAKPRSAAPRSATRSGGTGGGGATAGGKTYTVQKGDTLSGIAKKFYNDPNKWQKIYQANKSKLKGPNDLKVGQTLTIP